MTNASHQLVDALPYIDHEYNDPQIRAVVSWRICFLFFENINQIYL